MDLTPEELEAIASVRAKKAEKEKKEAEKKAAFDLKNRAVPSEEIEKFIQEKYGFYSKDLILYPIKKDKFGEIQDISINNNCASNYQILLHVFGHKVRYSEFEQKVFFNDHEIDDFEVSKFRRDCEQTLKNSVVKDSAQEGLFLEAKENSFDPLKEFFESLPKTAKTNHLDSWFIDYCGAEDTPINRVIGRKWLISAVARAYKPGTYVEGCLIFYGPQGKAKSDTFRTLNPNTDWFTDTTVEIGNEQKCAQTYNGKFIIEFAELNNVGKGDLEKVKSFLTSTHFNYIPKYSNNSMYIGKRMVYGGTTNRVDILDDPSGNRRFWVVEIGNINIKKLQQIKNDLWTEANAAYLAQPDRTVEDNGKLKHNWVLLDSEIEMLAQQNSKFTTFNELKWSIGAYLREERLDMIKEVDLTKHVKSNINKLAHPKSISDCMTALGWRRDNNSTWLKTPESNLDMYAEKTPNLIEDRSGTFFNKGN